MKIRTSHLLLLPVLCLLLVYNNCGVKRPSVEIASYASVGYKHTFSEVSCASCHESTRPSPLAGVLHGNKADCVACHVPVNDNKELQSVVWAGNSGAYSHPAVISSCVNCHAPNRPAPVNGFVHYGNKDCATCHHPGANNNTDGLTEAQIISAFKGAYSYTHPASGLTECRSCHEKDRLDPSHNPGQDCVSCHKTNDTWTPGLSLTDIHNIWFNSR
jgi:hypothetical protein